MTWALLDNSVYCELFSSNSIGWIWLELKICFQINWIIYVRNDMDSYFISIDNSKKSQNDTAKYGIEISIVFALAMK